MRVGQEGGTIHTRGRQMKETSGKGINRDKQTHTHASTTKVYISFPSNEKNNGNNEIRILLRNSIE